MQWWWHRKEFKSNSTQDETHIQVDAHLNWLTHWYWHKNCVGKNSRWALWKRPRSPWLRRCSNLCCMGKSTFKLDKVFNTLKETCTESGHGTCLWKQILGIPIRHQFSINLYSQWLGNLLVVQNNTKTLQTASPKLTPFNQLAAMTVTRQNKQTLRQTHTNHTNQSVWYRAIKANLESSYLSFERQFVTVKLVPKMHRKVLISKAAQFVKSTKQVTQSQSTLLEHKAPNRWPNPRVHS